MSEKDNKAEVSQKELKEISIARNIVKEIRDFGVNDSIICMIIEQLSLDLCDIQLMNELRSLVRESASNAKLLSTEAYEQSLSQKLEP
jgi:hypothetical protein